jgi:hypothetical protein
LCGHKQRIGMMRIKKIVSFVRIQTTDIKKIAKEYILHPTLLCAFWILYSYNEMAESSDLFELLQITLSICVASFLVTKLIFILQPHKKYRNSVYLFFVLSILLFGENFIFLLEKLPFISFLSKTRFILPVFFLCFVLLCWFTRNKKLDQFNFFLNSLTLIYCLWELINVGINEQKKTETRLKTTQITACDSCPDIYLILTDSYTNSKSLQKYWNYDNILFLNAMQNQGFYTVTNAASSYNKTIKTMSSMLNMNYLDKNLDKEFTNRKQQRSIYNQINHNEVMQKLAEKGYEIINLSLFRLQNTKPIISYHNNFVHTSLLNFLFSKTFLFRIHDAFGKQMIAAKDYQDRILQPFEYLKKISKNIHTKPQFVYLHLFAPHEPYIFDRNGKLQTAAQQKNAKNAYLEQLLFTNQLILEGTKSIIANNNRPALILVTGDHGFRDLETEPAKTQEALTTSTFFYFPDQKYDLLYDSMSSVNLFRAVLNKAIGTKLPYLPEKKTINSF